MVLILGIILKALIILGVFSVLILVHEAGHFFAAKKARIKVERFALGFGKKLIGIKKGDTEYAINLIPLGGYVKLMGEDPYERKGLPDEFSSKPIYSRLGVLAAGSLSNYLLAFLVLVGLYTVGMPMLSSEIGSVLTDSPALKAGLKSGDKIISIDKKEVQYWDEVVKIIRQDEDAEPLEIKIERLNPPQKLLGREPQSLDRGGSTNFLNVKVTPKVISAENIFKQKAKFVGIGIAPSEKIIMLKGNPLKSLEMAGRHVYYFTVLTYKGIWLLITGAMPIKENVGGPIRIIDMFAKSIQHGWYSVFSMMATVSMALAIFNLLPFPILDGGHILFLGIEKLRGKPLSAKTQEAITQVAIVLLIAFVLYVSYYDVRTVVRK